MIIVTYVWHSAFFFHLTFKTIYVFILVFILLCWVFIAAWACLSLRKVGATSSYSAQISLCDGFSCLGARALGPDGFSSCGSWALERRLNSCSRWARLIHSMWGLPGSRIEPMSPALAGGFFATGPPGKPSIQVSYLISYDKYFPHCFTV